MKFLMGVLVGLLIGVTFGIFMIALLSANEEDYNGFDR